MKIFSINKLLESLKKNKFKNNIKHIINPPIKGVGFF